MPRRLLLALPLASVLALAVASVAGAHSSISPPVAKVGTLQQFTLELQAEKEETRTTRVEVTFPDGFNVETFPASPGWTRSAENRGSGEAEHVQRVVWTGGEKSPREDPVFHFTATLQSAKTYPVRVRQQYADGSIVDWAGPEDSEQPAAFVEGVSSLGGGGRTSTLTIVALVLGGLALVLSVAALVTRGGNRPLA